MPPQRHECLDTNYDGMHRHLRLLQLYRLLLYLFTTHMTVYHDMSHLHHLKGLICVNDGMSPANTMRPNSQNVSELDFAIVAKVREGDYDLFNAESHDSLSLAKVMGHLR